MSPITIYYKDSQLDKWRTSKSILKYYWDCYRAGQPIHKVTIERSLDDLSTI